MNETPESAVRGFMAAWPRWQVDELAGFFDDAAVWVDGHHQPCIGIAAITARLEGIGRMLPGPTAEVKHLLVEGGTVMVERVDVIRLKGETFDVEVTGVFDVDADTRRLLRWRDYYDSRTLGDSVAALLRAP